MDQSKDIQRIFVDVCEDKNDILSLIDRMICDPFIKELIFKNLISASV